MSGNHNGTIMERLQRWITTERLFLLPFLAFLGTEAVMSIKYRTVDSAVTWTKDKQVIFERGLSESIDGKMVALEFRLSQKLDKLCDEVSRHERNDHPTPSLVQRVERLEKSNENINGQLTKIVQDVAAIKAVVVNGKG